jgi:hypothetical protein
MNFQWTDRLTRRFAEGEFDGGIVAAALVGLVAGAIFALGVLLDVQP